MNFLKLSNGFLFQIYEGCRNNLLSILVFCKLSPIKRLSMGLSSKAIKLGGISALTYQLVPSTLPMIVGPPCILKQV